MTEADILELTYTDLCTVYRPFKDIKLNGESIFRSGLEGKIVYQKLKCALSSPTGGKLQPTKSTATVPTDYELFVRPEVDIQKNDTVVVVRCGKEFILTAGQMLCHPSHNSVPMLLRKDKA